LVPLAAMFFFALLERASCLAGSLRLSVSQFGSGRLNKADLSEAESE
jgi:hypothetical protein